MTKYETNKTIEEIITTKHLIKTFRSAREANRQQDTQEVLMQLIDKIQFKENGEDRTALRYVKGKILSCVTCDDIKDAEPSITKDEFTNLILDIRGYDNIYQSIKVWLAGEKIPTFRHLQYGVQVATRTHIITDLPPILILFLKRFDYTNDGSKIRDKFVYNRRLNMNGFVHINNGTNLKIKNNNNEWFRKYNNYYPYYPKNGPYIYELKAIVNHTGPYFYNGHYSTYISPEGREFYLFNDISVIKQKGIFETETYGGLQNCAMFAYILIYTKTNMKSELNKTVSLSQEIIEYQNNYIKQLIEQEKLRKIEESKISIYYINGHNLEEIPNNNRFDMGYMSWFKQYKVLPNLTYHELLETVLPQTTNIDKTNLIVYHFLRNSKGCVRPSCEIYSLHSKVNPTDLINSTNDMHHRYFLCLDKPQDKMGRLLLGDKNIFLSLFGFCLKTILY